MAYKDEIANIAQEMHYGQAVPLLERLRPQWKQTLNGTLNLKQTPEYKFGSRGITTQTGTMTSDAMRDLLGVAPTGGQQIAKIGDIISGTGSARAGSQTELLANILTERRAEPTGFATGAPGAAMSGLSTPAQNQMLAKAQKDQQREEFIYGLGEWVGDSLK